MNDKSLISIITVSFNAVNLIEKTIKSVISQTYPNIEYIIIDGGSSDGTLEIIKKYKDKITYWISEPDNGIYDAMNKGIKLAKGDWINFMNAGDTFYNNTVLSNIFYRNYNTSVLYGNVYYKYEHLKIIEKASKPQLFDFSLSFCHQSSFVLSTILKQYLFDTQYKLSADYAFFMHILSKGHIFEYLDICISNYDTNGISSNNWKTNLENYKIYKKYNSLSYIKKTLFFLKLFFFQKMNISLIKLLNKKRLINKFHKTTNKYILITDDTNSEC